MAEPIFAMVCNGCGAVFEVTDLSVPMQEWFDTHRPCMQALHNPPPEIDEPLRQMLRKGERR